MNIFFLHWDPKICAVMYVDKHVLKIIIEITQMLCCAHHLTESEYVPPYKMTHKNHPCTIWIRTSKENYKYTVKLGLELCKEYTYRYGKIHKCQQYIEKLGENIPPIPSLGFTPPAQAMPDIYKCDDAVKAYRQYYFFEKWDLHTWKKRDVPKWIIEIENYFKT